MTRGFSLIEVLVSMALMVAFTAGVVSLVLSANTIARVQPEAAEQQQRTRIAAHALEQDLTHAGAGLDAGLHAGSLEQFFPAITPSLDGGITVWYVSSREAQATLASSAGPGTTQLTLGANVVCPPAQPSCAFGGSSTGILFDSGGCHDVVRIDAASNAALQLHAPLNGCAYAPGASIAEGEVRTFRVDPAARQLLRRDEATGVDLPVLDGVDAMTVEYFDDTVSANPAPIDPSLAPFGVRRVRITLRFAPNARGTLPDLSVSLDVTPPNLSLR